MTAPTRGHQEDRKRKLLAGEVTVRLKHARIWHKPDSGRPEIAEQAPEPRSSEKINETMWRVA